jgi:hypothetical protein
MHLVKDLAKNGTAEQHTKHTQSYIRDNRLLAMFSHISPSVNSTK